MLFKRYEWCGNKSCTGQTEARSVHGVFRPSPAPIAFVVFTLAMPHTRAKLRKTGHFSFWFI